MINEKYFFFIIIVFLFSCQSDLNKVEPSIVKGDNNSDELLSPHFIVYEKEKRVELWKNPNSIISTYDINNFLPFKNYGKINIDSFNHDFIYYTKDSLSFKQINFASGRPPLRDADVIFLPSKFNDFGHFSPCISCPEKIKVQYLKARLDYEDFFGK